MNNEHELLVTKIKFYFSWSFLEFLYDFETDGSFFHELFICAFYIRFVQHQCFTGMKQGFQPVLSTLTFLMLPKSTSATWDCLGFVWWVLKVDSIFLKTWSFGLVKEGFTLCVLPWTLLLLSKIYFPQSSSIILTLLLYSRILYYINMI